MVLVFFSYFYQKYIIKIYFDHELWDTLYIHKSVHVTKHVLTSLPLVDFVLEAPDRLRQIYIECVYEKKVNNQHRPNTEKKKQIITRNMILIYIKYAILLIYCMQLNEILIFYESNKKVMK